MDSQVNDAIAQNFPDYSNKIVLGDTLTNRRMNKANITKIAIDLEQLRFLEGKSNVKAKAKAEKLSKEIDKKLRRMGIKGFGHKGITALEDRVVRVLSGGSDKKTGTVEGVIQVPFGLASQEGSGYLTPRVTFSGDNIAIDFSRTGSNSSIAGLQGTQMARLEVESFLLSNESGIRQLLQ